MIYSTLTWEHHINRVEQVNRAITLQYPYHCFHDALLLPLKFVSNPIDRMNQFGTRTGSRDLFADIFYEIIYGAVVQGAIIRTRDLHF
jgi:hypothetical protein